MISVYTDTIELNNGLDVVSNEYIYISLEEIEELDWDLEDYFDFEKFGRDYADAHNGIEDDRGILIEE